MLDEAEKLLRQHGPRKVALSDIAAICGMSQSNAYRFFASRQALLDAVADRWFAEIERRLEEIVSADEPPAEQFVRFIARHYELKRERAVADPDLFRACLDPEVANSDVVERHLNRTHFQLETVMRRCAGQGLTGGRTPEEATALAEVMTARFRDPEQILRNLDTTTPLTAAQAAGILITGLAHLPR